jgi:hypothetical protein
MPLTKEALQEALADPDKPEAQAILNRISRFAGVIKGTRPFWYRRRRECESFAHCLGVPSTLIALSPANLHWQSLYKHMPEYEEWKAADEPRRMAISRRLLRENPRRKRTGRSKRRQWLCAGSCSRGRSGRPRSPRGLGKGWWSFEAERNDTHLNQYNALITLCWLANIDCSPCTSVEAVINYAAKYCSKSETQTSTYAQIAKSILPHISSHNPMVSFVSKLMNKLMGERDYSAQEICHVLLGLPLQEDSRVVQSVDCRPRDKQARPIDITAEGDVEESQAAYDKYLRRPDSMEEVSYFEFLQDWNFKARNPVKWVRWQPPALPRGSKLLPALQAGPHTPAVLRLLPLQTAP